MRLSFALLALFGASVGLARGADDPLLPKVAQGWSVELVSKAPEIAYPTAIVVAPDGAIYLGQDPMDMPGPPTVPNDSVVIIRGGKITKFADKLWAVMGLEWLDGSLFVVHAPYLSAFRDLDGDGKADSRVDLITGLGPKQPGFNGINDHIASGLRLGMDGFLYIAVGDKGIPRATGRDGTTITMSTGGVIRIRPDGTGLEVVSTGERNPLSVALSANDDVFTYGNDDDSKKWPNSLVHQIVRGHYGYPYEFLTAPSRALPIMDGQFGGSGTQGLCYNEDGLPARYRGNLFFCDWGSQTVVRYEIAPNGGTFKVVKKEPLVEKGDLEDFRPFSIANNADGSAFYLVDWGYNGWLGNGPETGRIFRLTYTGPDRVSPSARPTGTNLEDRIRALDHPALAVRLQAQRILASKRPSDLPALANRLKGGEPETGRVHALWALDSIGTPETRPSIRAALTDPATNIKVQAARSSGIRRDRQAVSKLIPLLKDAEPTVRREAAIALGRIGDPSAIPSLYAALGDDDVFASWSVRKAIRNLNGWDLPSMTAALEDPNRREDALKLADESWSLPAVQALAATLASSTDSGWKSRVLSALAGNYRRYPEWSGHWYGTNPLAGAMPRKTLDWAPEGMNAVLVGLVRGVRDSDPLVRRQAIFGLAGVGERATPLLRTELDRETDPVNLAVCSQALGSLGDLKAIPSLSRLLLDSGKPIEVRVVVLDALASLPSRQALNARLMLAYDAKAPDVLIARALPALGRGGALPPNDLAGFLDHSSEAVRAAALSAFPVGKPLSVDLRGLILKKLDDPSLLVRKAAIETLGTNKVREAIPQLLILAAQEDLRSESSRALAEMPDPRAFAVYVSSLSDRDPAVRNRAESALMAIRDVVARDLDSMARQGKFIGPAALSVERVLTKFQPVTRWKVIGPFPRTAAPLLGNADSIDFEKKQVGAEGRIVGWQARLGDPAAGRVILEDMKAGLGENGAVGYGASNSPDLAAFAVAEVNSDRDRTALLLVGSSGSIALEVNDKPLLNYQNPAGRPYATDSNVLRFSLKKGKNSILLLSRQGIGTWSFGILISEPSSIGVAGPPVNASLEGLRAFAASHQGDVVNGEKIFFEAKGVGCARCHAVNGKGTARIGPDLTGLANKYQKPEIIQSVLEPSNRLATGFQPLMIARRDGTVVTGMLKSENEDALEMTDADGKLFTVQKFEIDQRKVSEVSLMPAGLVDSLSPVEFADLISYLGSLKSK